MGWWSTQVTPRLVEVGSTGEEMLAYRRRVCEGLAGRVVELGFGSGANLEALPVGVTSIVAIEPSDVAWKRSEKRRASSPVPVERGGLDGQRLDLPDESADAVLSTFTLCTIPDADAALREVVRVLRPGGALHFFEHGLAPDDGVVRWQHRLEPLQMRLFDGCHLTRRIDRLVEDSGLVIETLERAYAPPPALMRPWVFGYLGRARRV
ncbi:MAG TPA: class I SAM-dependent methyltransferase [Humibacillus sp.]|nr:class I SAM-dependent methyltransferase [Humibacillus sp.]